MKQGWLSSVAWVALTPFLTGVAPAAQPDAANLAFACAADNDLYRVLSDLGRDWPRYDTPSEAVGAAPEGSGVLILADGYPQKTTAIGPAIYQAAAKKGLRLYVEFPADLPDVTVGKARRVNLERGVVTSTAFGETLKPMRIVMIHDCHFVEVEAKNPHIVAAKVAGFDTAAFGLDGADPRPILFEHPRGDILVSTTKLSQFVTARYATKEAWQAIWKMILGWVAGGTQVPDLDWTPTVRPTYARDEKLPPDAAERAIIRGIDWHSNAKMLMHASWKDKYDRYREEGIVDRHNPVGPRPDPSWASGDGEFGVLEGVNSTVRYNGEQLIRWWLRTDSVGESSLAFALRSKVDGDERSARIAANLLDWVYVKSGFFQNEPERANFGLTYWGTGNTALYGDNDIKIILGCIGASAVLKEKRWDEFLVKSIVGNFRTTGVYGFRGAALNDGELLSKGWRRFWRNRTIHYAPHYQAWIWSSYLWLYDKTGYEPLLTRTRGAIRMMMEAYPDNWRWTNGIQQERGRMLLTLAWLIRVDDRPEHRAWLRRMAEDMRKCQDACGAIREELGDLDKGSYRPPQSNAEYGGNEASLIQENGDPVADLLYTCNFAFLGLHEAYAATGESLYREMEDNLAEFLVRIQVKSEAHPELDGGWFRAFDFRRWDYWGSNADAGWGAWSIEVGWTQAWIPTVLALRHLGLNLWDVSEESQAAKRWEGIRDLMLREDQLEIPKAKEVRHAAVGKPVTLGAAPDPRYPGLGAKGLTDGKMAPENHASVEWMGYCGQDFEATIDLGEPTAILSLAANFLQSIDAGVFLPKRVEFASSDDGKDFTVLKTVAADTSPQETGAFSHTLTADDLKTTARYIRVRAANVGVVPDWHDAKGADAWLFVDEILVNP
ncbi:MAG TPA: discoidin domain-containing protein [Sumerlaeia bacterium]|nr:discoidin domain-containing protein [Sumerlaeia bacterium]